MKKPGSVDALNEFGRERLSQNFFMRDFLYSEIANIHGVQNIPDDPDLAIEAGRRLCEELLEPLNATFGRLAIRSAYRSPAVNHLGWSKQKEGKKGYACASNEKNFGRHIWDRRDKNGALGATACLVVPWFADRYADGADWRALAWWIHYHLPYSRLYFFRELCAFNITWSENPARHISSYINPKGTLTKPGLPNHDGDHSDWYEDFPELRHH